MCGIHLIWGKDASETAILSMLRQSRHRGPDQQASLNPWPGLWLGINRLKILHPGPEADQPFWASDKKSLLIWNGELYNYQEIKNSLIDLGITFTSRSDTEVVLHTLRIFGTEGIKKLEGMFALIYADVTEKSVLVARDKNGEKPLYYSQNEGSLTISSEIRCIQQVTSPALDVSQIAPYVYLRTPLLNHTFYKEIKEWKPDHLSKIHSPSSFQFIQNPSPPPPNSEPTYETFKTLLTDAVLKQFHADAPVGIQLSGGADSSLLYAIWYKQTATPLPSYTIQVEPKYRKNYSDGDSAVRLAKQFPTSHHPILITQELFWENWEEYLRSVDLPIGDSAGFLNWMIGKEAKKEVKVLISGAGADELWGGYQRHKAFARYQENKNLLLKLKPVGEKLPLGRSYRKFFSAIHPNPRQTYINFSGLANVPHRLTKEYEGVFDPTFSAYKQMLDFDRQVYLVQDVLKIQDNALMSHSIEGRSPYLDAPMVGFWKTIKDDPPLKDKPWIRQYLKEHELSWVADRKKMGFGLPLKEWLAEGGEFARRMFGSIQQFETTHGHHLPQETKALAVDPKHGVKHHFLTLYNLFLLAEWVNLHKL